MHSLLLLLRRAAPRRAEQSAPETGNFNELLQRFGVVGTLPCVYATFPGGGVRPGAVTSGATLPGYYADLLVKH